MTPVDFWFDPVSPYAYLAFERLPQAFAGLSYSVSYRPIVFAALLKHFDHKGPAEIEPKRAWTFRQVHWLAHRAGIALDTPERHPFNPIALSRLAWATGSGAMTPGRWVCETVLRHVWIGGGVADDPARLGELRERLAPALDPGSDEVKRRLRAATDDALGRGLFGVPTIGVGGRLFWGLDALDMAAAAIRGDPWFDAVWEREGRPRNGIVRAGTGAAPTVSGR